MSFIVNKDNYKELGRSQIGGKAYHLGLLSKFNVPTWFCLSTDAFTLYLKESHIDMDFHALLSEVSLENVKEKASQLQKLLSTGQFPESIINRIRENTSRDHYYAIRSSAVDEDGGEHSFAGILESYLFQRDLDQIMTSIIKCYQSCFSERALRYRLEKKIDLTLIKMSVIIQEMVDAKKAGVLFTANPTNGARNEFIFSATYGLGEGVVSGECQTDEYIYNIESENLTSNIQEKDFYYTINGISGTKKVEVASELKKQAVLEPGEVQKLVTLGKELTRLQKVPQDIEFAIANNQIYILQTRNITSLIPPKKSSAQNIVFDNSNIQESFCGVTTPLTFSYANEAYFRVYHQMLSIMGLSEKVIKKHEKRHWNMISFIKGRVYYNINSWYEGLLLFPSLESNKDSMEKMMGLQDPVDFITDKNLNFKEKLEILPTLIKCYWNLINYFIKIDKIVLDFTKHFEHEYSQFKRELFPFKDMGTLFKYTDQIIEKITAHWQAPIINDFYVMTFHGKALRMLQKLNIKNPELILSNLLSGEEGIQSTEPTKRLLKISDAISEHRELKSAIMNQQYELFDYLVTEKYLEIEKLIDQYIEEYGDRVIGELKLESISLRENKSFMYSCLKTYLEKEMSLQDYTKNEKVIREDTERNIFKEIKDKHGNSKLRQFKKLLNNTRKGVKYRENLRLLRTRVFGLSRDIYLEMGRQFQTYGKLEDYRDIFYLTLDELERYRMGRSVQTNLKALVKIRKEEERENLKDEPAHHFHTAGPVYLGNDFKYPYQQNTSTELKGLGCYPGVVTGEIVKMSHPDEVDNIKDKILCTMRTDPGWAPVFPMIKGLIVERGSMLSHSAVIARELRIPTIVSVPGITDKLNTGDLVQLDGGLGTIDLVEN